MRTRFWVGTSVTALAITAGLSIYPQSRGGKPTDMPQTVAFRIRLGVGDTQSTDWSGSIAASTGRIESIQGWRFRGDDTTDNHSTWSAWSGRSLINIGRQNAGSPPPTLENGVIVAASSDDPGAKFDVKTKQGDFAFTGGEIPIGTHERFLDGRVVVERVPGSVQLTRSLEDQDYPAIAQTDDMVYATYIEFVRGDRKQARWNTMGDDPPKSFDFVARPVGGDQVFLMSYSKAKRVWSEAMPVTGTHQDLMRAAVAVDGKKRVWVIYSANRDGNFDLYARSFSAGKFSAEQRLTTNVGTDINPVAATDASGRVWVAWQAYRNNNLEILASALEGDKFTAEKTVSFSKASDWDPSIAASANGEVAVAWDTYDKGDYDVYFRRLKMAGSMQMEAPVPVAASELFEARSSIGYDKQNRLWVAYETSEAKWGKDQGPYEKIGVPLYRNHNVAVKCFQGSNAFQPVADVTAVMPAAATPQTAQAANRKNAKKGNQPQVPADEHDTAGPAGQRMTLNSFPRLAIDPSGMVYITFRIRLFPGRTPAGSVWAEQMVYFDGAAWKGPIDVPNADEWIDNRPAMAAIAPGDLMMILASDHRQTEFLRDRRPKEQNANFLPDSVNVDIYASELLVKPATQEIQLKAVAAEKVSAPDAGVAPENDRVKSMRSYRAALGGEQLKILRGEFHRHTDLSLDGQGDGPLVDAYRYMIDAASMDWGACCDHDNGVGEYPWWLQQKFTDAYKLGDQYVAMFGHERSVSYPEGHRNAVFATRGIRPLPRLPKMANDSTGHAPDTLQLFEYLKKYDGIVASHTSGTDMGTDWRDNDPMVEPVVEIYQGCRQNYEMPGAPRAMTEDYAIGGWRPLGFVSLALKKGYRLAFQASSDHGSTHISYCNLWVTQPTREGVLEAFKKRRVYGATDNILADVRCGGHFMGEEFSTSTPPSIAVKLVGTGPFAKVHIVKDGEYVYSIEPGKQNVEFTWHDTNVTKGKTSYYYVRGEQKDGQLVWASPMWITYNGS
jgi:hypothetical protein